MLTLTLYGMKCGSDGVAVRGRRKWIKYISECAEVWKDSDANDYSKSESGHAGWCEDARERSVFYEKCVCGHSWIRRENRQVWR